LRRSAVRVALPSDASLPSPPMEST
jgi:hypothetical protein